MQSLGFNVFLFLSSLFSFFLFFFNKELSFIDCVQNTGVTGRPAAVISALAAHPSFCLSVIHSSKL